MQMQRLNADTLDQHIVVNSTGELRLLQRDIANVVKRLHFSFLELKEHTEQTEEDLRRTGYAGSSEHYLSSGTRSGDFVKSVKSVFLPISAMNSELH